MIARAGCTHTCRQGVREVVVVPTGWWHATCNAGAPEATVGIGGQDCCDAVEDGERGCSLDIPPRAKLLNQQGVPSVCQDAERAVACWGELGESAGAEIGARLLQPDQQVAASRRRAG